MSVNKLGYAVVNNTTTTVKRGPAGFFGLSVTGAGNVAVYDNTAGSGALLYSKTGAAVGDVVHFGGMGIACGIGLTIVTTGTVAILFT